ncbi:MAG: universal stress protein [Isosphaeraceae bacterium]|jgi:nucleotide-binding universal stress UspA family protein|nr:MAG: universal stress protein [Isosphaeraceae bacterium]
MERFANLLVSVVGDPTDPVALQRGVELARRVSARLTLIDVVEDPPWYVRLVVPESDRLLAAEMQSRGERLASLAASVRDSVAEITTEVLRGRADLETVRQVLRGGHDLVIKRADAADSGLFVTADMRLLRNCPCPVWLLRPTPRSRLFTRILAAVDPTREDWDPPAAARRDALNRKILDLATALAAWEPAELHVIHAWEPFGEGLCRRWGLGSDEVISEIIERMHAEAGRALEQTVAPYLDQIGPAQLHLVRGDPGQVIPRFAAEEHVDLIVMGTVARTGIAGLIIGNTAETILQRVTCSVLAVKPDGFVSPVTLESQGEPPRSNPLAPSRQTSAGSS